MTAELTPPKSWVFYFKNMKKRFLFYLDWRKQMSLLNDEQVRRFINNLCNYAEENPVDLPTDIEKAIWYGILPSLEINNEKYEKQAQRSRENGKLGGAPKDNQNARKYEKTTQWVENNLVSDKCKEISDKRKEINEKRKEKREDTSSSKQENTGPDTGSNTGGNFRDWYNENYIGMERIMLNSLNEEQKNKYNDLTAKEQLDYFTIWMKKRWKLLQQKTTKE